MKKTNYYDAVVTGGFWKKIQELNSTVTVKSVYDQFIDTGRFEAFKQKWREGEPNKPHFFWDSDVAKWIEGVAYILEREEQPELEKICDDTIDLLEKNQSEDGYFNSYYQVIEPQNRFTNRDNHELYCAGHLIEAAVAYYHATGKDKFLRCMCKYADLIDRIFRIEDCAEFHSPGHEEIELALVKLWQCTGERRYLELSKYFIDRRGTDDEKFPEWSQLKYYQSEMPVREMRSANGHAVRACYLYAGMADIAREFDDKELLTACKALFDDIYYRKLYITGGIGQNHHGEAFTVPFDMPNSDAYNETCASIALVYFASRMQLLETDSRYGDVIEKCIYNGIISGLSLDGKGFFYNNPLEIIHAQRDINVSVNPNRNPWYPITRRQELFTCSCCPPNLVRFIPSISEYICTSEDDTIYVHQYMSSSCVLDEGIRVSQSTGYPFDGKIEIAVKNAKGKSLALRIPGYTCGKYELLTDGAKEDYTENGYLYLKIKNDLATIIITFDVTPRLNYARPEIFYDINYCAVTAGPIVYCAESEDNGENLRSLKLPAELQYINAVNPTIGTNDLIVKGKRLVAVSDEMYSYTRKYEDTDIHLIPYYAFANRSDCDMAVWLPAE